MCASIYRYRQNFPSRTRTAQEIVPRINKEDYSKLKSSCIIKETTSRAIRQPVEWEKTFANSIPDRGLISRVHKELEKLFTRYPNGSSQKRQWMDSSQKKHKWPLNILKVLNILIHQGHVNKTAFTSHLALVRMAKIKKLKWQQMLVRMQGKRSPHSLLGEK